MACYHFIFHGYGTWLPDEDDGFVRRHQGRLPQDVVVARQYRTRMKGPETLFDEGQQRSLIDEVHVAASRQDFRVHFVATEPTHIPFLISWRDDRPGSKLEVSIKTSLSRRMHREHGSKARLSEGGSRRKVFDQERFDYLACTYLPEHSGWKWSEEKGLHK